MKKPMIMARRGALVVCTAAVLAAISSGAHAQGAAASAGGDPISHQVKMMDSNGDGKISADEHAAGAKQMFTMMDGNGDRKVTAAEMEAARARITGQAAAGGIKGKVAGAMSNKKGAPGAMGTSELSAAEKIKVVDKDGDGALNSDEHIAGSRLMFDKMDADHDGTLSKAELAAGHAKMMHKP